VQATIRYRQQLVDDRVEVFDACHRHAEFVRGRLEARRAEDPGAFLDVQTATPPADAVCPYDGPACGQSACDRHDGLLRSAVEDGQLMGTG
jgi:hypothetical protein